MCCFYVMKGLRMTALVTNCGVRLYTLDDIVFDVISDVSFGIVGLET